MAELYELPNGWEWKTINEVCTKVTDGAHKSPKTIEVGKPYITVRDINEDGLINFNECKFISDEDFDLLIKGNCKPNNGDILFSKDGTVGKVALVNYDIEFVVLSSLAILKPSENILSDYFKNYLLSPYFFDKAIKSKTGAAIKRVVLKTIKELSIPLPPLSEQQRIVAKLDKLFASIDKAIALHQKNIDEANVFMASVLNDVFTELEEKYGLQSLLNVVKINSGVALPSIFKDVETSEGEYEFFKVAQMNNDNRVMKDAELNFTLLQSKQHKIKLFPKGSILIPKRGGAILTNKKRILERDASYDSNVMGLKADNKILSDEFLFAFLDSINLADFVDTSTIPQINNKHIEMMNISTPPLPIQQKVVAYLDEISQKMEILKRVQNDKMASLKALKASILDKAFRGEL